VHAELTFSHNAQPLPTRCVADVTLQPGSFSLELAAFSVERGESLRLADADRPPPHDGECDENETSKDQGHEGSPSQRYAALRHARSLALRERGLEEVSA
jgi:hypothetical protein